MRVLIHSDGGISGLKGIGIGTVNGSATWVCKASGDGQSCEDIGDGTVEAKLHSSCFDAPEAAIALMNGADGRGFDCNEASHDWMLIMLNFARRAAFAGELTGTNPAERIFVFADISDGSNRYSTVNYTVDPILPRVMKFDRN